MRPAWPNSPACMRGARRETWRASGPRNHVYTFRLRVAINIRVSFARTYVAHKMTLGVAGFRINIRECESIFGNRYWRVYARDNERFRKIVLRVAGSFRGRMKIHVGVYMIVIWISGFWIVDGLLIFNGDRVREDSEIMLERSSLLCWTGRKEKKILF